MDQAALHKLIADQKAKMVLTRTTIEECQKSFEEEMAKLTLWLDENTNPDPQPDTTQEDPAPEPSATLYERCQKVLHVWEQAGSKVKNTRSTIRGLFEGSEENPELHAFRHVTPETISDEDWFKLNKALISGIKAKWPRLSTQVTNTSCLNSTLKEVFGAGRMENSELQHHYNNILNQHKATSEYQELPTEVLEKDLMCEDGTLLTTAKLREKANEELHKSIVTSVTADEANETVALGMVAYMGNRPQDFCVRVMRACDIPPFDPESNSEFACYDVDNSRFVYYGFGKTGKNKRYQKRVVSVPSPVKRALRALFNVYRGLGLCTSEWTETTLPQAGTCKTANEGFRKILYRAQRRHGFPQVAPTKLRNMFEMHTLYVDKMTPEEHKQLQHGIGHSPNRARKSYTESFKGLLTHEKGYDLPPSALEDHYSLPSSASETEEEGVCDELHALDLDNTPNTSVQT